MKHDTTEAALAFFIAIAVILTTLKLANVITVSWVLIGAIVIGPYLLWLGFALAAATVIGTLFLIDHIQYNLKKRHGKRSS